MGRRREGSVSKNVVTASGGKQYNYWVARISRPGNLPNGKRQRVSESFKTEREATDWLRKQLREAPRQASENLTVAEWVQPWLDGKTPTLKPGVRARYESIFDLHINPVIGKTRLDKLTVDDVLRVLKSVRQKPGRKGRSLDQRKIYMVLRGALTDAVQRDKMSFNPALKVDAPEVREHEPVILDMAQATRLLTKINGDPHSPLFTLILATGLRLGEALGLTWGRIDLDRNNLAVGQGLQWLKDQYAFVDGKLHEDILRRIPYKPASGGETKPYLLTVKSKKSNRSIPLARNLVEILKAHRVKQAQRFGIKPDSLVFQTDQGTPYRPENVERALAEYLTAAKLPILTPHELRHSWNNFARAVGTDPETRAALAGHLPSVNQDTYSHASEEERRRSADLVAKLIPA